MSCLQQHNCQQEDKVEVRTVMQIETEALAEKYLGLPTALGRSTKEAFEYMPARLKKLVGGLEWKGGELRWKRGATKISGASSPNLSDELFLDS
jgi:hypothetical protein